MSWAADFTDALCECKTAGLTFDAAWRLGMQAHPPQLRELGIRGAALDTLENQSCAAAVQWFRERCEHAWHDVPAPETTRAQAGLCSALRGMRAAMDLDLGVEEAPPKRAPRYSTLAA